jgi:hypothetical protein
MNDKFPAAIATVVLQTVLKAEAQITPTLRGILFDFRAE